MGNSIQDFSDQVRWLHEIEYGDFKRKLGLYLNRLQSSLEPAQQRAARDLFDQIRQDVLFNGKDDIEAARQRTLELADQIRVRISSGQH